MGNNISSDKHDILSMDRSQHDIEKRSSLSSIKQQPMIPRSITFIEKDKQPQSGQSVNKKKSSLFNHEEKSTNLISEKKRGKFPESFQPLNNGGIQRNRMQQRNLNTSRSNKLSPRDILNSTISASGISSSIVDYHFSMVGDSSFTDITNASAFSVNSFLDKIGEDNNYIMNIPDLDYSETTNKEYLSSIETVSTSDEIINLLLQYPNDTYDILTRIYGSDRMKHNLDLQKEAFQATETWSLRPTDVTAKTLVACCKLCGWGTTKNSKKGFQELQQLAKKNVWDAYYFLGQCYHYGIEQQANEGYSLSGRPLSVHVIQPVDKTQAIYWYKKLIEAPVVQSVRVQYYVAEAQFRIAAISLTSEDLALNNVDDVDECIEYLKQSASTGNRKAEFSLGFLIELGIIQNDLSAKEYYQRSAYKNYSHAQVQLAMILLKSNSPEAITWLTKASKLGDSRAFYYLGENFESGKVVKADPKVALQNYTISADDYHNRMAEFRLGFSYAYGRLGLTQDMIKAAEYLERSAKRGYSQAQYLLAMFYRENKIPIKNAKKEAFRLIQQAAAQRLHTAITQMANFYEEGFGTVVNYELATEYYEIATSMPGKSLPGAQITYARFLQKTCNFERALEMYLYAAGMKSNPLNTHPSGPGIVRDAKRTVALFYLDKNDTTTPYEPKKAFDILMSLASEKDAESEYWIGVCHEEGVPNVVNVSLEKAFEHYFTSAKLGSSNSQFQVGYMLCKGIGVKEDRLEAFQWFMKAAEQSNPKALYYIGIYYYNGSGSITRDLEQARFYFKRSAELKYVDAMVSYAQICQERLKNEPLSSTDKEICQNESLKWYSKAAKFNHTTALRELGRIYSVNGDFKNAVECYMKASSLNDALSTLILGGYYEKGQGVTLNKQTALDYYKKAIELKHKTALFAIAELYENLKEYEKAYDYYKLVSEDQGISKNYNSSKTSRLKMALYSLHYDPNTFVFDQIPLTKSHESIPGLLPKSEAFKILLNLAIQEKVTEAYNWIAECYQDGNGVSKNLNESLNWRKRAFEVEDINAIMRLAYMYEHGINGVQKNIAYSHQLYQICAEKDNSLCQHKLGLTFWRGQEIIPINLGLAVFWLTKSARQGYAASHWALGQIALENGDLHIAMAWWETAIQYTKDENQSFHSIDLVQLCKTGSSNDLIYLGKYIQNQQEPVLSSSDSVSSGSREEAEYMSRALQENHGLALRCFGQAALMGNVEGMYLTAEAWHKDKDYPMALENYEKAAAKGHVLSRIMCATYQIYGLGGKPVNANAGFKELSFCAEIDPNAYLHLGRCYEHGLGTQQNILKALELYQLAIKSLDSSEAMFRIGQIYSQREFVDIISMQRGEVINGGMQAIYWFQRAISKDDHPRANFRLAFYYIHGIQYHLEPDLNMAINYLRAAAKQNDLDAMFELGQMLLSTNQDHAIFPIELQKEGLEWFEIAADKGCPNALRELGNLYHTGRESIDDENEEESDDGYLIYPIQQDVDKAYDYFSFAANLGDKTSALFLGTYYEHGFCVTPNLDLAQLWYSRAIGLLDENIPRYDVSGWWPAQLCLARLLYQNTEAQDEAYRLFLTVYSHRPEQHLAYLELMIALHNIKQGANVETATQSLVNLAEQGYLKAFVPLARCYETGYGVPKDLSKAIKWYTLLISNPVEDQDNFDEEDRKDLSIAFYRLAEFYRKGTVVTFDIEKSNSLYEMAAKNGSKEAKQYLDSIDESYEMN